MRRSRSGLVVDVSVVLTAAVGLSALALLATVLDPERVAAASFPAREGARVEVEGRVVASRDGRAVLADGTGRVALLLRGPVPSPGADVAAVGTVVRDGRSFALSVESWTGRPARPEAALGPGAVALDPDRFEGTRITLSGVLVRVGGGDLRLRDRGEAVSLAVEWPEGAPAPEGGAALLTGRFVYDPRFAAFVLRVDGGSVGGRESPQRSGGDPASSTPSPS